METAARVVPPGRSGPRPWETLLVIAVTLGIALADPRLRGLAVLVPVAYLLIERRARHRPWGELGFRAREYVPALRANAGLVLLVALAVQLAAALLTHALLPQFRAHLLERLPGDLGARLPALLLTVLLATFGEELIFRAAFQKRLADSWPLPLAVAIASAAFAIMHFTPGPPALVATDLGLVALDGVLYGVIYARSGNLFVAWTAHALADFVGLALLFAVR